MSATDRPVRVLIVGESVFKIHTHFKGFASYETGYILSGGEGERDVAHGADIADGGVEDDERWRTSRIGSVIGRWGREFCRTS